MWFNNVVFRVKLWKMPPKNEEYISRLLVTNRKQNKNKSNMAMWHETKSWAQNHFCQAPAEVEIMIHVSEYYCLMIIAKFLHFINDRLFVRTLLFFDCFISAFRQNCCNYESSIPPLHSSLFSREELTPCIHLH